jgi:hypothetical protein
MRTFIVALALLVLLSTSCSGGAEPSSGPYGPGAGTSASQPASPSATASSAPAAPPPTGTPSAPTPVPPPAIAAEAFGLAQPLHEYWPVIRDAAGLHESNLFGGSMSALAYSPDGRYLAVAGCDTPAGQGYVFSPYTALCAYALAENEAHPFLYILDADTGSIIASVLETQEPVTVNRLAFSHDGNRLIYSFDTGRIEVWDIPSGRIQTVLSEETDLPEGIVVSPDGKWIALGGWSETRLWDVAQEQFVPDIPRGGASQFSADGHRLLLEDYPYLLLYDTSTWEQISERILMPDGNENIHAFSPDLSLMATCDTRLTDHPRPMHIWDVETGELVKSLNYEFSRCARLAFSPDGGLLLRFDDHGAGPMIWRVDGWKFVSGSDFKTSFVGDKDLYVNSMQFAQDGRTVLVDTFQRLTLYSLPQAEVASAPVTQPAPRAPTARPSVPTLVVKPQACDMVVTGWLKLQLQPCLPPSRGVAGSIELSGAMDEVQSIDLRDFEGTGVVLYIPSYLQTRLKPGTYPIADYTIPGGKMTASFNYFDHDRFLIDLFLSYDDGTLILSEAGPDEDYISGSYSFGAHNNDEYQIRVEGTFENIPFSRVNGP